MVPNDLTNGSAVWSLVRAGSVSTEHPAERLLRLWQGGSTPEIDSFLAGSGDLTPTQLAAVLLVDQRERWRLGQHIPAETYLQRYPSVCDNEEGTIDLVYGEYLLREKQGTAPPVDEFLWRFPKLAPVLKSQMELHQALRDTPAPEAPGDRQAARAETIAYERTTQPNPDGPVVPGYEILRELGRGGMGIVYKAYHVWLKRPVALKMLLAGAHAGAEELSRFRMEAEAAARLRHSNIVQVYEIGESDGRPFLVLEFIDGGSLKASLAGVPRPARWSAELLLTLARAVQYAHTQGVVHRDLKPANILLSAINEQPTVAVEPRAHAHVIPSTPEEAVRSAIDRHLPVAAKITDFGLAKQIGDQLSRDDATRTGDVLGTPSYMSPEQATGKLAAIGPATDVYALGSILYELLTGRPPFQADSPLGVLQQVVTEDPVSPSKLQRKLPHDLVTVCLKCLQKEPRRRYATAAALADDLGRFLANKPIRARPVGTTERLWRWGRRNPSLAGLAVLVTALVVVIVVGSILSSLRLRESAREQLWQAKLAEARAYRFSDRAGRRFKGLEALVKAARIRPASELRDEAIAGMALFDLRPTTVRPMPLGASNNHAFSRDLRRYAYSDERSGTVMIRRIEDDQELFRVRGPATPGALLVNQDGSFLAVFWDSARRVEVWKLTGEKPVLVAECRNVNSVGSIDFSPDGRHMAVGHANGTVQFWDLETARVTKDYPIGCAPDQIALHPTKRQWAVACESGVQIRDIDTGKLLVAFEHEQGVTGLAWHPGGCYLAVSAANIVLWNVKDRKQVATLSPATSGGIAVSFSRGGDLLVGFDWNRVMRVWEPWTGRELFRTDLPNGRPVGFSPDDRLVAIEIVESRLHLHELVRSPACRTLARLLKEGGGVISFPAVGTGGRARGRLLAVAMGDGVSLWDLATGTEVGNLSNEPASCVLFDSSGALWTNGPTGVRRWPVADDTGSSNGLRVGPPERLLTTSSWNQLACNENGSVAAVALGDGAVVRRSDQPGKEIRLQPHEDARYVAVSPRGEWVATGSHNGGAVKIWESSSGRIVKELPLGPSTVNFSPDGQWLLTTSKEYQLWRCGSWESGPSFGKTNQSAPSFTAFSPDGNRLLLNGGGGLMRMLDRDSGRVIAQFQSPFPDHGAFFVTCSPDSARIVTLATRCVHVWDLNAIGRELAAVGLIWGISTEVETPPAQTPLRVNVIEANAKQENLSRLETCSRSITLHPRAAENYWERGRAFMALERFEEADCDFSRAIEMRPEVRFYIARGDCRRRIGRHAEGAADLQAALQSGPSAGQEAATCNMLAWLHVAGPLELRAPEKAARLAGRAVRLMPDDMDYLNTLGVVYYRQGRFDEAVTVLRRSLRASASPPHDLFVLAMCYQKLGNAAKAQDYYDQALYWIRLHADTLGPMPRTELEAFKEEAKVLGLR